MTETTAYLMSTKEEVEASLKEPDVMVSRHDVARVILGLLEAWIELEQKHEG